MSSSWFTRFCSKLSRKRPIFRFYRICAIIAATLRGLVNLNANVAGAFQKHLGDRRLNSSAMPLPMTPTQFTAFVMASTSASNKLPTLSILSFSNVTHDSTKRFSFQLCRMLPLSAHQCTCSGLERSRSRRVHHAFMSLRIFFGNVFAAQHPAAGPRSTCHSRLGSFPHPPDWVRRPTQCRLRSTDS